MYCATKLRNGDLTAIIIALAFHERRADQTALRQALPVVIPLIIPGQTATMSRSEGA